MSYDQPRGRMGLLSVLILGMLLYPACGNNIQTAANRSQGDADNTGLLPPGTSPESCKAFNQSDAVRGRLDILFNLDFSDSMEDDIESMALGFADFVEVLSQGFDFSIAITAVTTQPFFLGPGIDKGRIHARLDRNSPLLQIADDLERREALANLVRDSDPNNNSNGDETPAMSAYYALHPDFTANNGPGGFNLGFPRGNAPLAIITVTDESDFSGIYQNELTNQMFVIDDLINLLRSLSVTRVKYNVIAHTTDATLDPIATPGQPPAQGGQQNDCFNTTVDDYHDPTGDFANRAITATDGQFLSLCNGGRRGEDWPGLLDAIATDFFEPFLCFPVVPPAVAPLVDVEALLVVLFDGTVIDRSQYELDRETGELCFGLASPVAQPNAMFNVCNLPDRIDGED